MATFKFIPPGTIKQGYLVKSPPLDKKLRIDAWKKRWCVFTIVERDPSLDYYKDEEEALSTLPIKRISLLKCSQIVCDMRHKNRKNVFALHLPERVYYFAASSHLEMAEWVDAFSENLKLTPIDGSNLPIISTPPLHRAAPDEAKKAATMPSNNYSTLSTSPVFPRTRTPDSPLPPIPSEPDSPLLSNSKASTLPPKFSSTLSTSPVFPRTRMRTPDSPLPPIPRAPDSPLPPIPVSPELSSRPRPPAIPVHPVPVDTSSLSTYPTRSPCSSPLVEIRSSSAMSSHCENGHLSGTESSKGRLIVDPPPTPPPHKSAKGTRSSSDDDDDDDTDEEALSPPVPPPRHASPVPSLNLSPPFSPPFDAEDGFSPPLPPPRDSPSHLSSSVT